MNSFSQYVHKLFIIFTLVSAIGCGLTTARPKAEMMMAVAAFKAARDREAQSKAPELFRKANLYYMKARSAYRRKYFNKAKQYALLAIKYSEKAEFQARKKEVAQ